nr:uncharacterized protein LOC115494896 isoform X1 [Taeniopygia guttata]XP_041571856.1 uncharacterized protein LOC115494896 isoform X1 [Taeniopygia guttata]
MFYVPTFSSVATLGAQEINGSMFKWLHVLLVLLSLGIGYYLISILHIGQMRTQRTGSRTSSTHMFPVQQGIQLMYWQAMMKRNQEMLKVLLSLGIGYYLISILHIGQMRTQRTGSRTSSTHMFPVQQGIQLMYWQAMMKRNQEMLKVLLSLGIGYYLISILHIGQMRTQR